jgi:hypothetical protein
MHAREVIDLRGFAHLLDSLNFVDTAIVKYKNTVFGQVEIHSLQKAFEPQQKLVTVVTTCFDMTVDYTVN